MGGPTAPGNPEESAVALLKLAKNITKEQTGKFLQKDGTCTGY